MHALKWWKQETRMFFAGGDGGGGSASPPAPSPSGGDSGGSVAPAEPAGGGATPPVPPSPAPASTPSATPAPAPGGTPAPAPAPEPNMWDNLGSTDDLDFLAIPPTPAPPTPTPPQPTPPAPTPPVPPQPGATPSPQPTPGPTPQEPQPPAAAQLSASDPAGIADAIEANRDAVLAHLAQTKFAFSEDDIKDLETDVVATMPKLLARVFMEAQMSMQKFLAQSVPGMVKQYQTVSTANNAAEQKFFATHKALDINNAQHRQTVVRLATLYRQANPTMPLEQLIQEVGPVAMAALQVNAPAASQMTPPRGGMPPFRPAVNGGGGSSPVPEPVNEWAGMGANYDDG